jgi:hypothetical protein
MQELDTPLAPHCTSPLVMAEARPLELVGIETVGPSAPVERNRRAAIRIHQVAAIIVDIDGRA